MCWRATWDGRWRAHPSGWLSALDEDRQRAEQRFCELSAALTGLWPDFGDGRAALQPALATFGRACIEALNRRAQAQREPRTSWVLRTVRQANPGARLKDPAPFRDCMCVLALILLAPTQYDSLYRTLTREESYEFQEVVLTLGQAALQSARMMREGVRERVREDAGAHPDGCSRTLVCPSRSWTPSVSCTSAPAD